MALRLRVIWFFLQIGEQYLLTSRNSAPTVGLHRHKYRINLFKSLWIVKSQSPALIRRIVYVHHAQIKRRVPIRTTQSPRLKSPRVFQTRLKVKVIGVEYQGLPFGIEHSSVRLLFFSITADVVHLGDVKIARAHQIANVTVCRQHTLLVFNGSVLVFKQLRHLLNLIFETYHAKRIVRSDLLHGFDSLLRYQKGSLLFLESASKVVTLHGNPLRLLLCFLVRCPKTRFQRLVLLSLLFDLGSQFRNKAFTMYEICLDRVSFAQEVGKFCSQSSVLYS